MIISVSKAQEAAGVLEIKLEGLTADVLKSAYRNKAKSCHPDHHPSKLGEWARVDWANTALKQWLEQHPQPEPELEGEGSCRACNGTGRVKVGTGFASKLTMMCVICHGLGSVIPQENDFD